MVAKRKTTAARKREKESAAILAHALHEKQREPKLASFLRNAPSGAILPVTVTGMTGVHVPFVDKLHRKGLPVEYCDDFYRSALRSEPWAKVALWDGCVVGALICKVSDEVVSCIHVRTLVSAAPRRKIATQLFDALLSDAATLGFLNTSLCVHVRNSAAIALYNSLGFQVTETRLGYYVSCKDKIEAPNDAFFMVRKATIARVGICAQLVDSSSELAEADSVDKSPSGQSISEVVAT